MAKAPQKTVAKRDAPAAAPRPGSLVLLSALSAISIVTLCGLGFWQLQRMGDKNDFLVRLAAQKDAAPAPLPAPGAWRGLDLDALDLTRVRVSGTWLPQATATVRVAMGQPQPGERRLGGFGRYLVTALRQDDGSIVLINRGFAPEAAVAALPAPTGRAQMTGIVRKPEPPNRFTPPANPAARDFHVRDPAAIAAALNMTAAPFLVEAERGADALTPPVGVDIGDLIARVPNNHLQYAFTWFGLAATLAGVFIAFVRGRRKPRA